MSVRNRALLTNKNVSFVYNPSFFDKKPSFEELQSYMNVSDYEKNARVIQIYYGRGQTYLINDHNNKHIFIRHYYRGGYAYKIFYDKFWRWSESSERSIQEYDLLLQMKQMGLPVPTPIVARVVKSGLFVRNDIVTQEIPGARNIGKVLLQRRLTDQEIVKIGEAIGQMFRAGIYHSDLNINNILLDGADNPWIVDFDKCSMTSITGKKAMEMINRLKRSFEKECSEHPEMQWSDADFQKLVPAIKTVGKGSY